MTGGETVRTSEVRACLCLKLYILGLDCVKHKNMSSLYQLIISGGSVQAGGVFRLEDRTCVGRDVAAAHSHFISVKTIIHPL